MSGNRRETTNARLAGEEPPYLAVGTEVSAKYRGAFCEANIKSVKKLVKCKVNFENGGGTSTVTDDCIIGRLKVGEDVKVKLPDGQDMVGSLVKITDSSSYTVVFDDGDERTLKRTSLCIKGEKHFNESETLDHLPLTDPENFGTPVMQQGKKSRKGRRNSLSLDESKESETPARKKLNIKSDENVDKVVMIELTEKKKSIQLPALLLSSTASHSELKSPENVCVRSFKDGKHIEVHPRDVKEFSKESFVNSTIIKGENPSLKTAVEHAVKYLETKQLPSNWANDGLKTEEMLKNESSHHSSASEAESDGDENEKSEFLEKLTKFLGEKGTPLVRSPVLGHRDLDLYKLYKIVSKMNGMDKVESWHTVYKKMNIPVVTTTASYHIKNAYKRYLYDYELHTRQKGEKMADEKVKKSEKDKKSSGEKSTLDNTAANSAHEKETPVGSDSEKDLKELPLLEDTKLSSQRKRTRKRGRGRRKTGTDRSLKSPNSPRLSPMSPCSPKSISSISASESTGCPSPRGNYCDLKELRGKIDSVLGKSSEKDVSKVEDVSESKTDSPNESDSINPKDGCNFKTRKEKKNKVCKENVSKSENDALKQENIVANVEDVIVNKEMDMNVEAGDDLTKDAESTCKGESLLKEDKIGDCNNLDKENLEKDSINDEEESGKDNQVKGTHSDEGASDDADDDGGEKTVEMDTHEDNQEPEGTDIEDAVDVVNSPSDTSETVDSDERSEQKAEKKTRKNGKGEDPTRTGTNRNEDCDDVDGLEYKLNDRIDVRYGRGRMATIYHAKITCVDPCADEGLYYLVHYQGWNARHDEWIGHERIIGHGVKQTRTRSVKEAAKNMKATPKPTAKPTPKPVVKKNGKNGASHVGRPPGGKDRKRTPSPTPDVATSSRNGNGRACKNRKDNTSERSVSESNSEVKYPARITRRNSLTMPAETSENDFLDPKSPETKSEDENEVVSSPSRTQRSVNQDAKSPSPNRHTEMPSEPAMEKDEKLDDVKLEGNVEKCEERTEKKAAECRANVLGVDIKIELEKALKRPREVEPESSFAESPPAKRKPEGNDSPTEEVFEAESPSKQTIDPEDTEHEPTADDTSGPDLTCSEQLPTHCSSPDPYTAEFPEGDRFYRNGVEGAEPGAKEKDSSSSLDEGKAEKPAPSRKTKCRRDRKARAPSSQSSVDTAECQNGASNSPTVTVMLSPSWTPRYNFTEDLDELLKNEESSERIRLLTERIKDIRKVYGELKSEVANIDRKRKRRQKRKREEELSAEENTTRSPSRSSPLTTTTATAVSSANTLSVVECR